MNAQELLQEISDYCRQTGLAESTFGRRAVNDGKLASRLRHGGRITTETLDRIRGFMASNRNAAGRPAVIPRTQDQMPARLPETPSTPRPMAHPTTMSPSISPIPTVPATAKNGADPRATSASSTTARNTCCSSPPAARSGWSPNGHHGTGNIRPRPPAVRIFDAGVGDGTVLARVMRSMHRRFPEFPFYVVGKEISLEDVRLALEKVPDRFSEHPGDHDDHDQHVLRRGAAA